MTNQAKANPTPVTSSQPNAAMAVTMGKTGKDDALMSPGNEMLPDNKKAPTLVGDTSKSEMKIKDPN